MTIRPGACVNAFRSRSFRYRLLLVLGLLCCGCSLLDPAPSSNQPPARATPRASAVAANSAATATARRATRTPRTTRQRATATIRTTRQRATASPRAAKEPTATTAIVSAPAARPIAGFTAVTPDDLPPEGRYTLQLIADGGPFPYRQDGAVFQNRERLLPRKGNGYYHEYTVETPGEDDRGARRIITGENGELFYTDDHYDSFVQVLPQ